MLGKVLAAGRYLLIVVVLAMFAIFVLLVFTSALATVRAVAEHISPFAVRDDSLKSLVVDAILLVDVFLLATASYMVAVGIYDLFIDDTIPLPPPLVIRSFDELKSRLIGVVIVVMAVLFLARAAEWTGGWDILALGGGVAATIAALAVFLRLGHDEH